MLRLVVLLVLSSAVLTLVQFQSLILAVISPTAGYRCSCDDLTLFAVVKCIRRSDVHIFTDTVSLSFKFIAYNFAREIYLMKLMYVFITVT